MARLARFLKLAPADRRVFVQAALFLWLFRLGLWLLPFGTLRRLAGRLAEPVARPCAPAELVVAAVLTMSNYVPAATCLTRGLAAHVILSRNGHASCLRIGVARDGKERLEAHAWVELNGRVAVGGLRDLRRYVALLPFGGESLPDGPVV